MASSIMESTVSLESNVNIDPEILEILKKWTINTNEVFLQYIINLVMTNRNKEGIRIIMKLIKDDNDRISVINYMFKIREESDKAALELINNRKITNNNEQENPSKQIDPREDVMRKLRGLFFDYKNMFKDNKDCIKVVKSNVLKYIEEDPWNIKLVPTSVLMNDVEFSIAAVSKNGNVMRVIPTKVLSNYPQICNYAIENEPAVFKAIPVKVLHDGFAIEDFEPILKRRGMSLAHMVPILESKSAFGSLWSIIKTNNASLGKDASIDNHKFIQGRKEVVYNLCKTAVTQNGLAYQYVTPFMLLIEKQLLKKGEPTLIELALKNNGMALEFLIYPVEGTDNDDFTFYINMCYIALSFNAFAIMFIPANILIQNIDLCYLAIEKDPLVIEKIPSKVQMADLGICYRALSLNPESAMYLAREVIDELHSFNKA